MTHATLHEEIERLQRWLAEAQAGVWKHQNAVQFFERIVTRREKQLDEAKQQLAGLVALETSAP